MLSNTQCYNPHKILMYLLQLHSTEVEPSKMYGNFCKFYWPLNTTLWRTFCELVLQGEAQEDPYIDPHTNRMKVLKTSIIHYIVASQCFSLCIFGQVEGICWSRRSFLIVTTVTPPQAKISPQILFQLQTGSMGLFFLYLTCIMVFKWQTN